MYISWLISEKEGRGVLAFAVMVRGKSFFSQV